MKQQNTLEKLHSEPILTAIDTPISISLAEHLTPEEREQILQTVETLKAITDANPDDYQSLEILKDAYWRLEDQAEGLATTRKLADAYLRLGQYSSALLEYEGILLQEPGCAEVQTLLEELETKLNRGKTGSSKTAIALDFGLAEMPEPELAPDDLSSTEPALIAGLRSGRRLRTSTNRSRAFSCSTGWPRRKLSIKPSNWCAAPTPRYRQTLRPIPLRRDCSTK
ncbi:MAG: hypothetical protein WCI40_06600 [Verrucomicrobiota bacterium]